MKLSDPYTLFELNEMEARLRNGWLSLYEEALLTEILKHAGRIPK